MQDWILGGGLLGLISLIFLYTRSFDAKIGTVYRRLDETKKYQDATFTRVDICSLRHDQITEKLDKMDKKLDVIVNGKEYR